MKKLYYSIFDTKVVNKTRQFEIDMAKVVLMFFLPFVHLTGECINDLSKGLPYFFDSIIGGPFGAPVFMFTIGFGLVYARKNSPRDLTIHAIRVGIAGIILNIFRYLIPSLIGYAITHNREYYLDTLLNKMFESDILQFAFLAIIAIALMIKFKFRHYVMLLVGIGCSIVGNLPFIKGLDTGNDLLNMVLGYFIGTANKDETIYSTFPLLNWLIIPIIGYIFTRYWIKVKNKDLFYLVVSPISAIIGLIYIFYGVANGRGMFAEGEYCYYHLRLDDAIASMFVLFAMLGLYHVLGKVFSKGIKNFVMGASKVLTSYYCIHYFLVCMSVYVFIFPFGPPHGKDIMEKGKDFISMPWVLALSAIIVVATGIVTHFYRKFREADIFLSRIRFK